MSRWSAGPYREGRRWVIVYRTNAGRSRCEFRTRWGAKRALRRLWATS